MSESEKRDPEVQGVERGDSQPAPPADVSPSRNEIDYAAIRKFGQYAGLGTGVEVEYPEAATEEIQDSAFRARYAVNDGTVDDLVERLGEFGSAIDGFAEESQELLDALSSPESQVWEDFQKCGAETRAGILEAVTMLKTGDEKSGRQSAEKLLDLFTGIYDD